jgi:hypothetical protein
VQLTWQSERTGIEQKWFALTGRVVAAKVEADGDLHLAIGDATGNKPELLFAKYLVLLPRILVEMKANAAAARRKTSFRLVPTAFWSHAVEEIVELRRLCASARRKNGPHPRGFPLGSGSVEAQLLCRLN